MSAPPVVTYEVWEKNLRTGVETRRHEGERGYDTPRIPREYLSARWNKEEAELARIEQRDVRTRYFVVKATTTFEEV